jgi:propionyl-CoA carboxylase beta chain
VAASRGDLDDVIMPREMRRRIGRALKALRNKKVEGHWNKHHNLPL